MSSVCLMVLYCVIPISIEVARLSETATPTFASVLALRDHLCCGNSVDTQEHLHSCVLYVMV